MRFFAVAAAALVFTGAAAADTFTDGSGEDPASADISTVSVANDPQARTFTIKVQVTNLPTFTDDAGFGIIFDADRNAHTGDPDGFEYEFISTSTGWYFAKWDGTQYTQVTGLPLLVSYENGLLTATFHESDIGGGAAFDFYVITVRGADPSNPAVDQAPDSGVYSYTLLHPVAVKVAGTTVEVSAAPKAGASFSVSSFDVKLSDGTSVGATGRKCTATLGGAKLAGTGAGGCTFRVPKTAHGKKLSVKVSGTYAGTTLSKAVAYKVK